MSNDDITLYGHARSGNCYKAALMLALTGTPFTFRNIDLPGGEQRGDAFKAVSAFGKLPVLVHGDLTIRQSNTILLHLAAHTGRFGSKGVANRTRISEWLFWEQDVFFLGIGRRRFMIHVAKGDPKVIEFMGIVGNAALDTLEQALADDPWLAGDDPTIADVCVYAYARLAEQANYDLSDRARVRQWRERVEALPSWAPPEALMPG